MATYLVSESSVQDGALRELYTITLGATVYRLTSHDRDVTYDGQTYTSTAGLSRGNIELGRATKIREVIVTLPVTHPVVLALIPVPPRVATLTIERVHEGATAASTDRRIAWSGSIANLQTDGGAGEYARIRVPGAIDLALDVRLPVLSASRACQHQLYGVGCGVSRAAHVKTPTVVSVTGRTIVVSALTGWTTEATGGEVERTLDGERRSIVSQSGTTIVVDAPFTTLTAGNALSVWRGCDKAITTCKNGFANVANFSGAPLLPEDNPASPTGRGVR